MSNVWSPTEVEAIVADYFAMLRLELAGRPYDKTEHRRRLQRVLDGRSKSSVEYKRHNISAVLINFGQPYIDGYKPRYNYQALLEQVVLEYLESDRELMAVAEASALVNPSARPTHGDDAQTWDVTTLIVAPPERRESAVGGPREPRPAVRVDFVERDARNRTLGRHGEEWALELERRRLHDVERRADLARRVEWVADTRGDGLGYDIASFNHDGSPRLIEVKTTGHGKHFPFYVTANELHTSRHHAAAFHLYRVFDFSTRPRMYPLVGALDTVCTLVPRTFEARVG